MFFWDSSAGHPQLPEPQDTTVHTLLLGWTAKMPPLSLNSSHALGFQSSPAPSDHAHQDPKPEESCLAGKSCGNSGLRGTTQLLMTLLEHPSSA